mmetsp:Transcript_7963/g.15163  ORF Transcript_7963/g.15163 Transcript_7963/m.15163 type:complete len:537 (-) Transcript_7963:507-2117(-)
MVLAKAGSSSTSTWRGRVLRSSPPSSASCTDCLLSLTVTMLPCCRTPTTVAKWPFNDSFPPPPCAKSLSLTLCPNRARTSRGAHAASACSASSCCTARTFAAASCRTDRSWASLASRTEDRRFFFTNATVAFACCLASTSACSTSSFALSLAWSLPRFLASISAASARRFFSAGGSFSHFFLDSIIITINTTRAKRLRCAFWIVFAATSHCSCCSLPSVEAIRLTLRVRRSLRPLAMACTRLADVSKAKNSSSESGRTLSSDTVVAALTLCKRKMAEMLSSLLSRLSLRPLRGDTTDDSDDACFSRMALPSSTEDKRSRTSELLTASEREAAVMRSCSFANSFHLERSASAASESGSFFADINPNSEVGAATDGRNFMFRAVGSTPLTTLPWLLLLFWLTRNEATKDDLRSRSPCGLVCGVGCCFSVRVTFSSPCALHASKQPTNSLRLRTIVLSTNSTRHSPSELLPTRLANAPLLSACPPITKHVTLNELGSKSKPSGFASHTTIVATAALPVASPKPPPPLWPSLSPPAPERR